MRVPLLYPFNNNLSNTQINIPHVFKFLIIIVLFSHFKLSFGITAPNVSAPNNIMAFSPNQSTNNTGRTAKFSTDGLQLEEVHITKKTTSVFEDFKKHLTVELGLVSSFNSTKMDKRSAGLSLAYNNTWDMLSVKFLGGYYYSMQEFTFVSMTGLETNINYVYTYDKFTFNEFYAKLSPSKYFMINVGRQNVTWGQLDILPLIANLTLPLNDNITSITPLKTDFLYPQDIASISIFPTDTQEFSLYYFFKPRLSPLFDKTIGEIINQYDIPPLWAIRYAYFHSDFVIALTYIQGISFMRVVSDGIKVVKTSDGRYYQTFKHDLNYNKNYRASNTHSLGFEVSYNFNTNWTFKAESLSSIMETYIEPQVPSVLISNKIMYPNKEQEALDFLATRENTLYTKLQIVTSVAAVYSNKRWDTSIGILYINELEDPFTKENIKHLSKLRQLEDLYIPPIPLLSVAYSFNDEKTKSLGAFIGNNSVFFGAGLFFKHDFNDYVSYGAMGGLYLDYTRMLTMVNVMTQNDFPEKYFNDFNSLQTIQRFNLFFRMKI